MEIITKKFEVFTYDELNESAQEKVLQELGQWSVDHDWFDSIYEDAKTIGIEIDEFDLYDNTIGGSYIESPGAVIKLIKENHGEKCATYKTAAAYKERFNSLPLDDDGDKIEDDDLENDFKNSLLEDYLVMLKNDFEYLQSEECIKETIESNEYKFLENGEVFN